MRDLLRFHLHGHLLCLLLAFAPVMSLRAQCGDAPILGDLPETLTLACNQARAVGLAALPTGTETCFRVDAATGSPIAASLAPVLRETLLVVGDLPVATSACGGEVEICVSDLVNSGSEACFDTLTLTRTYSARNLASNASSAPASRAQIIYFLRPQLGLLETFPVVTHLVPNTGDELLENPAPHPQDYPFFVLPGGKVHLSPDFCDFTLTYRDAVRNTGCGNNFAFVRTYQVTDECGDDNSVFTQLVRVGDQRDVLSNPALQVENPITFSANAGCNAVIDTRLNNVLSREDLCDDNGSLAAYVYLNAQLTGTPLGPYDVFSSDLQSSRTAPVPLGRHLIRYVGQDSYGSPATLDIDFNVVDNTPPVMICQTGITIDLGENGQGRLNAVMLDGGTHDYCGDFTVTAARSDASGRPTGPFRSALNFFCDDIGEMSLLLQAIDATGFNRGRCLSIVTIADAVRPSCAAPPAVTLNCQDFADNFPRNLAAAFTADPAATGLLLNQRFGSANPVDNCDSLRLRQFIRGELNGCGTGRFTRSFVVNDGTGFTQVDICLQQITVRPYLEYSLFLPGDQSYTCNTLPGTADIVLEETGCGLLSVTTATDSLQTETDACYQLRRTYDIINWCEYDGASAPLEIPRTPPDEGPSASVYLHLDARDDNTLTDDRAVLDDDADQRNGTTLRELIENYGTTRGRGAYRFVQYVSVTDNEAPSVTIPTPDAGAAITDDCLGNVVLSFTATDDCVVPQTRIDLDINVIDRNGDGDYNRMDFENDRRVSAGRFSGDPDTLVEVSIRFLPIGRHLARVQTTDRCGNLNEQYVALNVQDGRGPVPACIEQNTIHLFPDPDFGGVASVIARDFISGDPAICSPTEVTYAIYSEAEATQLGFLPASEERRLDFDCSDLGENLLRVYAFSTSSGLYDYCNVQVEITAPDSIICDGRRGAISGRIFTTGGEASVRSDVYIRGQTDQLTTTDDNGDYSFDGLKENRRFRVRPFSNDRPSNGLTTADISLVNDIILGINEPLSPYLMIAADVNNSGFVTVEDLFELRAVILGTELNFSMTDSWRFLPANYVFPDPDNPWAEVFPEESEFDPLVGTVVADFVAIKVGDVNGTARPAVTTGSGSISNLVTNVPLTDQLLNVALRPDALVPGRWALFPPEGPALAGLQLSLQLPAGATVASGTLDPSGYRIDAQGVLHLIHLRTGDGGLRADLPMLTIVASAAAPHFELLANEEAVLQPEAYFSGGRKHRLGLVAGPSFSSRTDAVVTASVFPNPVQDGATLSFNWPVAERVTVAITDINGRLVSQRFQFAAAGANGHPLTAADLGDAPGVYFIGIRGAERMAVVRVVKSGR